MGAGRKPQGVRLLDELDGDDSQAKRAMQVFLRTMMGECTIQDACRELGVNQSWFFERRKRWLQESLDLLGPRAMGRPPNPAAEAEARVAELEQEVQKLKAQLAAANLRTALAGGAPPSAPRAYKKKATQIRRRGRRRGRPK